MKVNGEKDVDLWETECGMCNEKGTCQRQFLDSGMQHRISERSRLWKEDDEFGLRCAYESPGGARQWEFVCTC